MVIVHAYVSLPEGIRHHYRAVCPTFRHMHILNVCPSYLDTSQAHLLPACNPTILRQFHRATENHGFELVNPW